MARKTVPFNQAGIEKLPNDKPVVYKIETPSGKNNYTGIAQRGRVRERLGEHLPEGKDPVPGAKVVVEQAKSIAEAREKEQRIITRSQPKYNEQDK
jgi:hypothetical protein